MCGRFTLATETLDLVAETQALTPTLFDGVDWQARYNVAPTQAHPIVTFEREDLAAQTARWGLVNRWAKDAKRAGRQINARSETVATSRAYASAFKRRRCLIPADGWYEWSGPKDQRQPHWIHHADGVPFLFAGIYEAWFPERDQPQTTFSIITTDANQTLVAIHARMPVVVPADRVDEWLDPQRDPDALVPLMAAAPNDAFVSRPVSTRVNSVRNDDPSLLNSVQQRTLDTL